MKINDDNDTKPQSIAVKVINANKGGVSATLRSGYYKAGVANAFCSDGHRQPFIIEIYESKT